MIKNIVSSKALILATAIIFVISLVCQAQEKQGPLAPENANEERLNRMQPPGKVLEAIGVKPGMFVGEIGAGRGRYTVQIAARVGNTGGVYANDIDAAALRHLQKRCAKWEITNIKTILGEETVPNFPENSLDLIFMISTYHHIGDPVSLMRNAIPALKPDSRLAIAEWVPTERGINTNHSTTPEEMERQMNAAGYELLRTETFLSPCYIYIFRVAGENAK